MQGYRSKDFLQKSLQLDLYASIYMQCLPNKADSKSLERRTHVENILRNNKLFVDRLIIYCRFSKVRQSYLVVFY
jgi:hypothetical protein